MKWVCKIFLLSLFLFMKRQMTSSAFKLKKCTKVKIPVYNISLWPFFFSTFIPIIVPNPAMQALFGLFGISVTDEAAKRYLKFVPSMRKRVWSIDFKRKLLDLLRYGNGEDKEVEIVIDDISKCIAKLLKFLKWIAR